MSIGFMKKCSCSSSKRKRYFYGLQRKVERKRTEANLTQVELAEKAGVTARTIQNYELGSRKPSNMVTIQKIADALNTTTEYLLGSSGTYVVEAHEKAAQKQRKILKNWSAK